MDAVRALVLLAAVAGCSEYGIRRDRDLDDDGYAEDVDCDDLDPAVHPDAEERCDLVDEDCDGLVDEDVTPAWYPDDDGDGAGRPEDAVLQCSVPPGYVGLGGDCDDTRADVGPLAPEICDGIDDDCDGKVDEDLLLLYWLDGDGDGFGDPDSPVRVCERTASESDQPLDCDDADGGVHPGALEVCNGVDDDCDGGIDEAVVPTWYADADGDGFGDADTALEACEAPPGHVAIDGDCDDALPFVFPGADELCDGVDDDCDGAVDEGVLLRFFPDVDRDGFGAAPGVDGCEAPPGHVAASGDCDDALPFVFPGAPEVCDGLDDDCDGVVDEGVLPTWSYDGDGDGHGVPDYVLEVCVPPAGWVALDDDCDDANAARAPGLPELCDDLDNDCDSVIDEGVGSVWWADDDADGLGDPTRSTSDCLPPDGWVPNPGDCDDGDASVPPGCVDRGPDWPAFRAGPARTNAVAAWIGDGPLVPGWTLPDPTAQLVVVDDAVYYGAGNVFVGYHLEAVDLATGTSRWSVPGSAGYGLQLHDGGLYGVTSQSLDDVVYRVDPATGLATFAATPGGWIANDVVVADEGVFVQNTETGVTSVTRLDPDDGNVVWASAIHLDSGLPAVHGGVVLAQDAPSQVADPMRVRAFVPETGAEAWYADIEPASFPFGFTSSPVGYGDLVLVETDSPGAEPNRLRAVDLAGAEVWSTRSAFVGPPSAHAGLVAVLEADGVVLRSAEKGFEVGRIPLVPPAGSDTGVLLTDDAAVVVGADGLHVFRLLDLSEVAVIPGIVATEVVVAGGRLFVAGPGGIQTWTW